MPRLIKRWLEAGVLESGQWKPVESGTPQGAALVPSLRMLFFTTSSISGFISGEDGAQPGQ